MEFSHQHNQCKTTSTNHKITVTSTIDILNKHLILGAIIRLEVFNNLSILCYAKDQNGECKWHL